MPPQFKSIKSVIWTYLHWSRSAAKAIDHLINSAALVRGLTISRVDLMINLNWVALSLGS